jgi:cytochrome c oxidase cbb3-type subunit I/II
MPPYPHLYTEKFDQKTLPRKIAVMVQLGVPYPPWMALRSRPSRHRAGHQIVEELKTQGKAPRPIPRSSLLIAYLQKLGKYDTPEVEGKLNVPGSPQLIPGPVNPDKSRSTKVGE